MKSISQLLTRLIVLFITSFTLMAVDCGGVQAERTCNISNKWSIPNYGAPGRVLILYIRDDEKKNIVTGMNSTKTLKIKGKIKGNIFQGTWHDETQLAPNNKGKLSMIFSNDCSEMDGTWEFDPATKDLPDIISGRALGITASEAYRFQVMTDEDLKHLMPD